MIRITILEDEKNQRKILKKYLNNYQKEHTETSFIIEEYEYSHDLLEHYRCDSDILLLDICISDMLGTDVARHIRKIDPNVIIIFITNSAQYAIEGYEVQATDYILKPLSYASFCTKMERILRILSHRELGTLVHLKTKDGVIYLSASNILYIEIINHDIFIHTTDGKVIKQWGSLTKFEDLLKNDHFVRCNSCYLVNLKYVTGVKGDDVLVKDKKLLMSKPRRKEFLQTLARYRGGSQ